MNAKPRIASLATVVLCAWAALGPTGAHALLPIDSSANLSIQQSALQLFGAGSGSAAVALLSQSLRIDPGANRDCVTGQTLIGIAFMLHARGQSDPAINAAQLALVQANAVAQETATAHEFGELYFNCGLLCERITHNPNQALTLYQAALTAEPTNKLAKQRLAMLRSKLNLPNP